MKRLFQILIVAGVVLAFLIFWLILLHAYAE